MSIVKKKTQVFPHSSEFETPQNFKDFSAEFIPCLMVLPFGENVYPIHITNTSTRRNAEQKYEVSLYGSCSSYMSRQKINTRADYDNKT
jgi:hypothetical protein